MTPVRHEPARGPPVLLDHLERPQVLDEPVGERAVELEPVPVRAHAAVPQEVPRVLVREQVLPGGHRPRVRLRELRLELEVERVPGLLVPEQAVGLEGVGVRPGGRQIEPAVGVHREAAPVAHDLQHRLDPPQVLVQRRAADLHLDDPVAALPVAAHLLLEGGEVLARVVVAARRVHPHRVVGDAAAVAIRQQPVERLARDLRDRVPDGHVDRADRDGALAVTPRLLVPHEGGPDAERVQVVVGLVDEGPRVGLEEAREEALPQEGALAVPTVRVEPVPDHPATVADDVGHERDDRAGHPREVDVGVGDRRRDRDGLLVQLDDPHAGPPACRASSCARRCSCATDDGESRARRLRGNAALLRASGMLPRCE